MDLQSLEVLRMLRELAENERQFRALCDSARRDPEWTTLLYAELADKGYLPPFKVLDDGRVCALMPLAGIDALCIGISGWGHNDVYYYHANGDAAIALDMWDGRGEPAGWFRHPPSGRRRADGREYYQP